MSRRPLWFAPLVLFSLATCDYGTVTLVAPVPPAVGPFNLLLQADSDGATTAQQLGWVSGVPNADVTLTPQDSTVTPYTGRTDTSGRVTFAQLPAGRYTVEAHRWLSAAEQGQLAPGEDVIGFAVVQEVSHDGFGRTHPLLAPASRRHSLVITEWAFNPGTVPGAEEYLFGGFLELYNNADTTVYLDSLIVGQTYFLTFATSYASCAQQAPLKLDPNYLWAHWFNQFPGTGRDYPLAPGQVAVIATDAIDHSAILPGGLDLRGANFEFLGPNDVDNPSVPNMLDIGVEPTLFGHGFWGDINLSVMFIARPVDLAALPRQRSPGDGREYLGFPRDHIVEVAALKTPYEDPTITDCGAVVSPTFDRREAQLIGGATAGDFLWSIHRKVAFARPDGRKVIQHTRTAAADFVKGARTPGTVP